MILTSYHLIFLTILGLSGIGFRLGAKTLFIAVIISLGIVGMISDVLSTFVPGVLKYLYYGLFALGTFFHIKNRGNAFRNITFRISDPLLLIAIIFLFRGLNSNFYIFESGDIVYHGSSLEMLLADYLSPLRMLTYYPEQLAAMHKLPAGIVAYTLLFFDRPTLIDAIDARYAIIVLSLFLFFRVLIEKKPIIMSIFCCSVMIIYGEEMSYEFAISSYFYVLALFSLAYILFVKNESVQSFIIVFLVLICAKAPIFYSALICSIIGGSIFWSQIDKRVVLMFSIGVAAVIASWAVLPPPPHTGSGFNLYTGLTSEDAVRALNGVRNWTLSDPVVLAIHSYFKSIPLVAAYLFLAIIIVKVYVVGALVNKSIGFQCGIGGHERAVSTQQQMSFLLSLYLFISLAGYLWLRNNGSISHQAHGPILAAALVAALCCIWAVQQTDFRRLLWAPLLMIAYLPQSGKIEIPHNHLGERFVQSGGAMIWTATKALPENQNDSIYYQPQPEEPMAASQLYAALLGLRLKVEDAPGLPAEGVNLHWPKGDGSWRN